MVPNDLSHSAEHNPRSTTSEERSPSTSVKMSGTEAYDFIRKCISHRPESKRREALGPVIEAGIDWNTVCHEAARHGIRPLFFHTLERLFGDRIPSSLHNHIQEFQQRNRIHANFLIRELCKIRRRCEESDLPILALKGPVLSRAAYGDIAMRRYVDLDLHIPRERFSELDHLLKEMGYEYPKARKKIAGWRRTLFRALKGQWQFTRAEGAFELDVHTRLMPPGYSLPSNFDLFWERSRMIQLDDDIAVPGLAPEDSVLVLSYHGVKNQWRSLKYVADLAQLLRTETALNWSSLIEHAQKIRATRVLGLGLSLAHGVLDMPIPTEIQKWMPRTPTDEARSVLQSYLRNRDKRSRLDFRKRVQLQLATKDTVADTIRHGAYSMMQHLWSTVLKP